jgi:hypothetical protein
MPARQRELSLAWRRAHRLHHRLMQRRDGDIRAAGRSGSGNPGRMLEDIAHRVDEGGRRHGIEAVEGEQRGGRHGRSLKPFALPAKP